MPGPYRHLYGWVVGVFSLASSCVRTSQPCVQLCSFDSTFPSTRSVNRA